jgi:hypothetical protein
MSDIAIQNNPEMECSIRLVGSEKTPVIVIDNLLTQSLALREYAFTVAKFSADKLTVYPGVRALLPKTYIDAIQRIISPLFRQHYGLAKHSKCATTMAYFSLLTTPVEKLEMLQRMPHFDSAKNNNFAVVHYLNEGDFGGTGFFQHRPTGFEKIVDHRYSSYLFAAKTFIKNNGQPPMKYISSSDAHYELIESIAYKPNRLVAYPGTLLHSGLVQPDRDIDANPVTGRLTANLFIQFDSE